jgi:hypothetical protein
MCRGWRTRTGVSHRLALAGILIALVIAGMLSGASATGAFRSSNVDPTSAPEVRSDPEAGDEDLGETSEADPVVSANCQPDPELGSDDFCPQIEEPNGPGDEFGSTAPATATASAAPSQSLIPGGPGWGMSEQDPTAFADPRFDELAPKRLRYIANWDQVTRGLQARANDKPDRDSKEDRRRLDDLDDFIKAANERGLEVLLSFGHTRDRWETPNHKELNDLPTRRQYKTALKTTLKTYPTIRHFTAWNEPNHADQPTSFQRSGAVRDPKRAERGPKRAAQYFKILKRVCKDLDRRCWVAAGDFADLQSLINPGAKGAAGKSYLRRYVEALGGARVDYWAIHPYVAGKGGKFQRPFRRFMKLTAKYPGSSKVWLTEYGQQLTQEVDGQEVDKFPDDKRGAGPNRKNLRRAMALRNDYGRITRFYYYKFRDDTATSDNPHPWRSGLIDPSNATRCLYFVYRYNSNPKASAPVPSKCPSSPSPSAR